MTQVNLAVDFDFQFPPKPAPLSVVEREEYKARIKLLVKEKNAVLVAHYYTDPEIQARWKWQDLVITIQQTH